MDTDTKNTENIASANDGGIGEGTGGGGGIGDGIADPGPSAKENTTATDKIDTTGMQLKSFDILAKLARISVDAALELGLPFVAILQDPRTGEPVSLGCLPETASPQYLEAARKIEPRAVQFVEGINALENAIEALVDSIIGQAGKPAPTAKDVH